MSIRAIVDLRDDRKANINLLTHLERRRLTFLAAEGATFDEARAQAEEEVLAIFGMVTSGGDEFQTLDLTGGSSADGMLLAASALLLQAAYLNNEERPVAELSNLLASLVSDIEQDGTLDDRALRNLLRESGQTLDLDEVRTNLEEHLQELGTGGRVPDFEQFIDADGDGILDGEDDNDPGDIALAATTDAERSTVFLSETIELSDIHPEGTVEIALEDTTERSSRVGFVSGTLPPRLFVNGTLVEELPATAKQGDTLQVEVTSAGIFGAEVSAELRVGDATTEFVVRTRSAEELRAEGSLESPLDLGILSDFDSKIVGTVGQNVSYYVMEILPNGGPYFLTFLPGENVRISLYYNPEFSGTPVCEFDQTGPSNVCYGFSEEGLLYIKVDGTDTPEGAYFEVLGDV